MGRHERYESFIQNNYRHANGGAKTLTIKKLKSVYLNFEIQFYLKITRLNKHMKTLACIDKSFNPIEASFSTVSAYKTSHTIQENPSWSLLVIGWPIRTLQILNEENAWNDNANVQAIRMIV